MVSESEQYIPESFGSHIATKPRIDRALGSNFQALAREFSALKNDGCLNQK